MTFTKDCVLKPGTYTMQVKTTQEKYGCYYFSNSGAMKAVLTATYTLPGVAYINNEAYLCYIGDGTNWNPYSIHIGNGTDWDKCGV